MALGLPLSWKKGLRGNSVPWIGGDSALAHLVVRVKQKLFVATETLLLPVICRELALELAELAFVSVVAQYLPDIANTLSDALSRMAQPMSSVTLPSFLKGATPVFPLVREAAYFRTVTDPVMPTKVGYTSWARKVHISAQVFLNV